MNYGHQLMGKLKKDEYILKSLRSIGRNKEWEVYVVTRIIHLLNDENLEFACQQCVKDKGNDKYYLTDLCFPSLGLYIEVNEIGHSGKKGEIKDKERQEAIQNSISWKQLDIDTYKYDADAKKKVNKTVKDVNKTIEYIVEKIKKRKSEIESSGEKIIWDYNAKYDPKIYINNGSINPEKNISFRYIRHVLRLFGYKKGNIQTGAWRIKCTDEWVWFPKLYINVDKDGVEWINKVENNLKTITMQRKINGVLTETPELLERAIVFAHQKNLLGQVVYRFMGVYKPSKECCAKARAFKDGKWDETNSKKNVYHRVKEKELDLSQYHINNN
jgi:uncharacterized protein YoxC